MRKASQASRLRAGSRRPYAHSIAQLAASSFLTCCCLSVSASEVGKGGPCIYDLSGDFDTVTPSQVRVALAGAKTLDCDSIAFRFDSGGGDVSAAIEAGDLLRSVGATTIVPFSASCASACVVAFVGGAFRFVGGRVGLHRPYPLVGASTAAAAGARREKLNATLRRYVTRMNIPGQLVDEMNATPSGSVRWLDGLRDPDVDELRRLQISGSDPAWAEARDSKRANKLGISLAELYHRQQRSEIECPDGNTEAAAIQSLRCREDILKGIR
jgi:hypothetical protein